MLASDLITMCVRTWSGSAWRRLAPKAQPKKTSRTHEQKVSFVVGEPVGRQWMLRPPTDKQGTSTCVHTDYMVMLCMKIEEGSHTSLIAIHAMENCPQSLAIPATKIHGLDDKYSHLACDSNHGESEGSGMSYEKLGVETWQANVEANWNGSQRGVDVRPSAPH